MQVLLIRHGNTFPDGQKSVWVGSATDLPLTPKGVEQARAVASFLAAFRIQLRDIYAGPMTRHRQHATEIASSLGMPLSKLITDDRLQEIDYGAWEGKTNSEVEEMGFGPELSSWNSEAAWPTHAGWKTDEKTLSRNVETFLADAARIYAEFDTIVAITSGGVLRYFYKAVMGTTAAPADSKVATGNVSSVFYAQRQWKVNFWNSPPTDLPL